MADVHDVAALILNRYSSVDAFKLQKLVYYCQAWNLVATDEPLFTDSIKAYENGPVVGRLFYSHKGRRRLSPHDLNEGSTENLTDSEQGLIDAVLDAYGSLTSDELVELTHREDPWINAWARASVNPRIDQASMRKFYAHMSAIPADQRNDDQRVPRLSDARVTYVCPDDLAEMTSEDDEPSGALLLAVRRARANLG
ncbi:DUF4065 domain-containing protein [Rhodococcus sp. IEGM 1366]|uniref:Panacea domain-containing protein n=1 Tax=Rhodococcus sp. IEGM 1366 TaxID=3082223 RepID=UPI0029531509|nr:type II toxin-antitoxin system antitoxin SocA domain-containing protein [Rhodococcus sp. IEGM 1366]MDV8065545.1 DUF4065 domain-containing protein [Rhodococcus sp. IEGM 1366]